MIKSILLAVDGSVFSDSVLQYGLQCARQFRAILRVLTVIDIRIFEWAVAIGVEGFAPVIPSSTYQEESKKLLDQKADEVLNKTEKILSGQDAQFSMEKESGNPVDVICDKARYVDLVIMGARGEFARWNAKMLGATLEATTRLSIKPVMVVPKDFRPISKILVAYDGSKNASKALTLAGHFAASLQTPLDILNINSSRDTADSILSDAVEYLSAYDLPTTEKHIAEGDPAQLIVQTAHQLADDLIVMGSYGHSRIREAILGSTTVQVMRNSDLPILMAR